MSNWYTSNPTVHQRFHELFVCAEHAGDMYGLVALLLPDGLKSQSN